jgi:hypothetical protein
VDRVPLATTLRLLETAPIVSFLEVRVEKDSMLSSDNLDHTSKLEYLIVKEEQSARELYELLAQPQFKSYTSTLRRLSIPSLDNQTGAKLLLAPASVLEHVHFGGMLSPCTSLTRLIRLA